MNNLKPEAKSETPNKTGFIQRIIGKIDASMKAKADAKSEESCCSGKGKDGKCC